MGVPAAGSQVEDLKIRYTISTAIAADIAVSAYYVQQPLSTTKARGNNVQERTLKKRGSWQSTSSSAMHAHYLRQ